MTKKKSEKTEEKKVSEETVAEDRRTGEAYQQFAEPERENRRTDSTGIRRTSDGR